MIAHEGHDHPPTKAARAACRRAMTASEGVDASIKRHPAKGTQAPRAAKPKRKGKGLPDGEDTAICPHDHVVGRRTKQTGKRYYYCLDCQTHSAKVFGTVTPDPDTMIKTEPHEFVPLEHFEQMCVHCGRTEDAQLHEH